MTLTSPKRRIDLDDTGMVWRVERGEASVMAEPAPGSDLPRASETLIHVRQGGYVFGISSEDTANKVRVFLEVSPGTRLVPMMTEHFIDLCKRNPDDAAKLISDAIRQLAVHVSPGIPTTEVSKTLKPGNNFRLPAGTKVAALTETWFRMDSGSGHYGGAKAVLQLSGSDTFLPVAGNMWVELDERSRLICVSTHDLLRAGVFFEHFTVFSSMALNMIFEKFSALALGKLARLMESTKHSCEEFSRALDQAVAVIDPEVAPEVGGPSVLAAITAVGKALGAQVKAPPRTKDDVTGQLEDILNHNGMYSREVALSGRWFEEDAGPLLGFLEENDTPIALLKEKKGYYFFAPTTGKKRVGHGGACCKDFRKSTPDISAAATRRTHAHVPDQIQLPWLW